MEITPAFKQVFYILYDELNRDFYREHSKTHLFTAPLITNARFFSSLECAEKYKKDNNLKNLAVAKVSTSLTKV